MARTYLKIIFFIVLTAMISCKTKQNIQLVNYPYKVNKIDSLNNYYIINISNASKKYQVVSKKIRSNCEVIKVNQTYPSFMFDPLIKEADFIPKNRPANYLDFVPNKLELDDSTAIIREKGMDNIYKTNNLSGLCYRSLVPMIK